MYAVDTPNGAFLVVVFTLCSAATILFAALSVRPSLRPAGLFERLLAASGAAGIAMLATGVLQRSRV